MLQYWSYLKYVICHKWYVLKECIWWSFNINSVVFFRMLWRGLKHDMSKFLPSEFFPYANHFYNKDGSKRQIRDKTGYYKPTNTGNEEFDFAWLLHQKRNRHHWQWWILPKDCGDTEILEMSYLDMVEMICDWAGAGKAQGFKQPKGWKWRYLETYKWWRKNREKMALHPNVYEWINDFLVDEYEGYENYTGD